ncbi:hypothetical protein [Roseimaritima sediminicola]|uniref:hypothetical protein n=1 Tax=Roseimaritima sediminicola TaxID=2662066 RepID=UPI00129852E4|nr:hypothetical protein [Roseimaritima sediminicola]
MDSDKIKNFFAQHIEKMVLGGICVFALFLIMQGMGYPMFRDSEFEPEELQSKATEVKRNIDQPHNEAVLALLPPAEPKSYRQRIAQLQKQIPYEEYPHTALEQLRVDSSIKRIDPALVAPIELRMTGVLASMAVKGGRETSYPAAELENAEPKEVEEEKPRRRERGRRGRRGGGEAEYMGMGQEAMMMMSDPYGTGGEGATPDYMAGGGSGEMQSMDPMGMGMGMGEAMPGMGVTRRLDPKYNLGTKVTGNVQTTTTEDSRTPKRPLRAIPHSAWFIAGTAALPHKELVESYKNTFEKTKGYKPLRDRPIYLGYDVQRADVTGKTVDQLADEDWVDVDGWERMNFYALNWWEGYAPDIIPADYRDPKLTALIPPLLIYDFTHFATHPKIPLKSMAEIAREEADPLGGVELPDIFDPNAPAVPTRRPGAGMNPGMGMEMGMGMEPGMGMGMEMGMGMGTARGPEKNPPEFKMVRFYDFYHPRAPNPPKPGRSYVYRLRVKLEDPNFPENPALTPTLRSLSAEVFQRVVPKIEAAKTTKKRDFVITTPWSDPSPVVQLPRRIEMYAGPIIEPASTKDVPVANQTVTYERSPARAKAVVAVWDWDYALAVPAPMDVRPGTVLNDTLDAEVVDPLTLTIKTKPNSAVRTHAVVLDVTGGEPLQLQEEDDLTRPGMVFVYDPVQGGLKVLQEIDDRFRFGRYTFAEDKPKQADPSMMMPMDGMDPGYMQMSPP